MATSKPAAPKATTVARPIPVDAPVTSAAFLSRLILCKPQKYEHVHYILGVSVKARVVKPATLGIRERNKLRKRQRIQVAVRELFSKHGYDEATLRGIAKRAHVALGTLFNYADDKRDLVFLIVNEEQEEVTT